MVSRVLIQQLRRCLGICSHTKPLLKFLIWRPKEPDKSEQREIKNREVVGMVYGFAFFFFIFSLLDYVGIYETNVEIISTILFTILSLLLAQTSSVYLNKHIDIPKDELTGIVTALLTTILALMYVEFDIQREVLILIIIIIGLYSAYANTYYVGKTVADIAAFYLVAVSLSVEVVIELVFFSAGHPISTLGRALYGYLLFIIVHLSRHSDYKYSRPIWIVSVTSLLVYFLGILISVGLFLT